MWTSRQLDTTGTGSEEFFDKFFCGKKSRNHPSQLLDIDLAR